MTTLHVECPTGLAGDMLLSALIDLGVPQTVVDEALAALGWSDRYRLLVKEGRSGGLRGLRLTVESLEPDPPHRHWEDLRQQFELADWSPALKRRVLAVFTALAEAEATVHGLPSDRVHFHEVGAIDDGIDGTNLMKVHTIGRHAMDGRLSLCKGGEHRQHAAFQSR